jgi:hypothetical protein
VGRLLDLVFCEQGLSFQDFLLLLSLRYRVRDQEVVGPGRDCGQRYLYLFHVAVPRLQEYAPPAVHQPDRPAECTFEAEPDLLMGGDRRGPQEQPRCLRARQSSWVS